MKKRVILLCSILVIYIVLKFLFSYTIINIPFIKGKTFEGGDKYKFNFCIINRFTTKKLEIKIDQYINNTLNDTISKNKIDEKNKIRYSLIKNEKIIDYRISSINSEDNLNYILIEEKNNENKSFLVIFDKEFDKVLKIQF